MMLRQFSRRRPVFSSFNPRHYSTIPPHLFVRQGKNDKLCMVASTATVLNAKYNAPIYGLYDMQALFEKTLKVGDSSAAGYDNSNFVPVLKGLGMKPSYFGCHSGLPYETEKLKLMLAGGWFMVSINSGFQKHSCVLCGVDDYKQFHFYDPAYGAILSRQFSDINKIGLSLDYFIERD